MYKQLLDVDPLTRVATWHYYDPATDETTIEEVQDVQPYIELATKLRNDDQYTRDGIKAEMWHYAKIPAVVQTQLLRRGIDIYNKHQSKEVLKIINTEYPWLKTTRGRHG